MQVPKELEFICQKCHEIHKAKHGVEPKACAFLAFDNAPCDDLQELINKLKSPIPK